MSIIRKSALALLTAAGLAALWAAPQIKVDNMVFNGGTVSENSTVKAVFTLTNTGTQPLRITSVRPGCGCTVVSYDSVIAPGKSGTIKPAVDLKGFRPGHMSRGVTVNSNAANSPTLQLTIEVTITPTIEVSENYIVFANAAPKTMTLSSAKKDLAVSGVVFKPQGGGGGNAPRWASNAPVTIDYKFNASDSTRADGLKVYRLDLTPPSTDGETLSGVFVITTNHPDKKEISINGRTQ